jgi:hypothetical protein
MKLKDSNTKTTLENIRLDVQSISQQDIIDINIHNGGTTYRIYTISQSS